MPIAELNLTKPQHDWIHGWLELWGAWVYSGRLEKRQSSVIAQFMERVEPSRVMSRPMCNDDDGMLISQVVDSVMCIDPEAYKILLSYYAHGSSQYSIAVYMHKVARPRKMGTRGGNRVINPSLSFFRRIVKEKLEASLYLLYEPLRIAMNNRKRVAKIRKVA
ncbi:antiterminator Q family protein [Pectobacterium odoriferum]|uniref:antiterminator Q family protein n=1 Tax=Pectobacterium odoriferum TaxID=78398 RepID=UPI0032EACB99